MKEQPRFKLLTFRELCALKPEQPERKTKTCYDKKSMMIWVDDEASGYPVDCERLDGSAEVLDYIFQILDKQWCTPDTIYDFLQCVEEACHDRFGRSTQGVFCSMGMDHKVNWKKKTAEQR